MIVNPNEINWLPDIEEYDYPAAAHRDRYAGEGDRFRWNSRHFYRQATKHYTSTVIKILPPALFGLTNMSLALARRNKMSKILATLIAGLFAASVFAADAPKAETKSAPTATPTASAPSDATGAAKTGQKHHKHGKKDAAKAATPTATPSK